MPSVRVVTRWATLCGLPATALVIAGIAAAIAQGVAESGLANPDELVRLNALIVANPTNAELNLRYAQAAEARGLWRLALTAYERLLLNDSHNAEALAGLQRVRLQIVPSRTQYSAEVGAVFESNPRNLPNNFKGEGQIEAALGVNDERA